MTAVYTKTVKYITVDGRIKQRVDCLIVADEAPATLPVSGEGIDGMTADMLFAPMSVLYVVAADASPKIYIANENGEFVGQ